MERLPVRLTPMLAVAGPLPDRPGWAFEFKWDGMRVLAAATGARDGLRLTGRSGRDLTGLYPELAALAGAAGSAPVLLDGEVVALDAGGRPSFAALQQRMHVADPARARRLATTAPVSYFAFDLLHLAGESTRSLPYRERRSLLATLTPDGRAWHVPPSYDRDGPAVLAAARQRGLEGVMAKRLDSVYRPGARSRDWVKIRLVRIQSVVIGGWRAGAGRRRDTIGALLLGLPHPPHPDPAPAAPALDYVGDVGSGFSDEDLSFLLARLQFYETPISPFRSPPPAGRIRGVRYVRPVLVGEVGFSEWTPDRRLRHPVWRGLRPDLAAREVRDES